MTIAQSGSNSSQSEQQSLGNRLERNGKLPLHSVREGQAQKHGDRHSDISQAEMVAAVETLIKGLGEDLSREGLVKTPQRVVEAMRFLTSGYDQSLEELVNGAIFDVGHDEMVLIRDISLFSLCEHHMLPFIGRAHVGYIPTQKVVGL
ncbi:MAG: GTP cyclohydrolase I, partial [Synechococcaceae cyanobacterium SM2_3_1]|nr:GTP cyclohydrolase I [Synechococcaceae cyanobacterium SM2_3_1]